MSKKTVLITGGAQRVGRMLSLGLQNYNLILHYHTSEKEARELEQELKNHDVNVSLIQADLTEQSDIDKLVAWIQKKTGQLDVLINNAASYEKTDFSKPLDFESIFDINLKAPLILAQKASKIMPKHSSIINICDRSALHPFRGYLLHSISKNALLYSTQALAEELAPHIRVNALLLGAVLPNEATSSDLFYQLIDKHVLLKREPKAQEIVSAVQMIIENDYLNAATITLDGGWKF